jgi:hypothetical protein
MRNLNPRTGSARRAAKTGDWEGNMVFALYEPDSELTALFSLGAVVVWGLAAFAGTTMGRRAGGPIGLVALGLAVIVFPTMWRTMDVAF